MAIVNVDTYTRAYTLPLLIKGTIRDYHGECEVRTLENPSLEEAHIDKTFDKIIEFELMHA